MPEGLGIGAPPLLEELRQLHSLLPLGREGRRCPIANRPEPPHIRHKEQGGIGLIRLQQGQISLAAIAGQQPGQGELESMNGRGTARRKLLLHPAGQLLVVPPAAQRKQVALYPFWRGHRRRTAGRMGRHSAWRAPAVAPL